jgi:Methylamine utilisation protein MauE
MGLFPVFVAVCMLLVAAGLAKLRSPVGVRDALSGARVQVPRVAVRALGAAEVALGAGASLRPSPLTAGLVALSYGAFCAFVLLRGPARCGCFGAAEADGGLVHALLNAAACAVAVVAAVVPPPGVGWIFGQKSLIAAPLVLGIAAATLAGYLMFTVFPVAWRAYGVGRQ